MKIFKQETNKSCGIACLRSIMNFYGNSFSEKDVWEKHKPF
jgi:ABC-type bacteriocin/lantibiotic exporter with double-glycine peptidase domain